MSLWDKKDLKLRQLSGGMKRRVLIAKALSHEPSILFLDEPTAGVDVELRKDMWNVVDILRKTGVTIILTTHYIEEAEAIADRVAVINQGEIIVVENKNDLLKIKKRLRKHAVIHEDMKRFFDGFPPNAHPMAILSSMVTALSFYHQEDSDLTHNESIDLNIVRLLAKVKTIAAYSYRKSHGLPFIYPDTELGYVENFLHMMFSDSQEEYHNEEVIVEALNLLLILHADHEQNCSTSTVRMVGSSKANLYATISAGISALWGPLHGGANQAVIEMLKMIHLSLIHI